MPKKYRKEGCSCCRETPNRMTSKSFMKHILSISYLFALCFYSPVFALKYYSVNLPTWLSYTNRHRSE